MSDTQAPAAPEPPMPWLGLLAVLLGTFVSTLNTRFSAFGLGDIRGAVHAGFDQGAWITTAQTASQMLVAPVAVWAGGAFGPRRVLVQAAAAYAVISFLTPFSPDLRTLLVMQFAGGAASGFFIPVTLSFILRNTPPRTWAYGIALYALNLELSLNISASLEGWYVDNLSWKWIYWQNIPLALGMWALMRFGVRPDPPSPDGPRPDIYGFVTIGVGLSLIYAGLDQGNRLDWLNSGLIWGLLLAGAVLVGAFALHETRTPHPFINLKVALSAPIPGLLLFVAFLRLTILSTAYLIPQYLGVVRGFRALEVGDTLIWIAAPQFLTCGLAAVMLRRFDPRLVSSIGFILIAVACLLVAGGLTPDWGSPEFLPSQLLQAVGQSLALSGVVFFAVLHLRPEDALTFGASLQTARLMGGEIGTAFIVTLVRIRSQTASNLIGLHVQIGDWMVAQRLAIYRAVTRPTTDPALASLSVLDGVVRRAAAIEGVIDGFVAIGFLTAICLLLVVIHKEAPIGPASHRPLLATSPAGAAEPGGEESPT